MDDRDRFCVNAAIAASKLFDTEAIVINTATGRYFDLEGCGADLWVMLGPGTTVDEAAIALASTYGLDVGPVRADVTSFFARLQEEDLIVGSGDAATMSPPSAPAARNRYEPPVLTTFTDMEELLAADPPLPADYTPVFKPTGADGG